MRITRATPDDLGALVAFRDEAAAWLAADGIDQWQEPWPTEDLMVEGMLRNIEAGETFIVWDDDHTPAATITVNRWAKPELWTEQERAEPALYANERLQHYYLREGFTYVRTVVLPHNPSGALFQRPARRIPTPHLQEVERLTG
jgi:hypothetical protein